VYFGTDADTVENATKASPEYQGQKAIGEEVFDPGKLLLETTYYWRIDEVNGVNPNSPWKGPVWSFTTGNCFVIDDFENYDAYDNQIWYTWHDGLGYGAPTTDPYFPGNGTGATVGDENTFSYTEETIVHGGGQSMPLVYDNNKQGYAYYSEVGHTLTDQRDWTEEGVSVLSLWFRGHPASVGSFTEDPAGTYTMTGAGGDIWHQADEFHYAYKMLNGAGSIEARIDSIENTHQWAKAGVMVREMLDAGSKHAFVYITPGNGVAFKRRITTDGGSYNNSQSGITAPHWVKLERDIAGNFSASHSYDGSTWEMIDNFTSTIIPMTSDANIGLALTSHYPILTCEAVFSNVKITGTVSPHWMNEDIGIISNDAEPLYVAIANNGNEPTVVYHNDPTASTIDKWTQWDIDLSKFAYHGIDLTDVDSIALGLGTRGNITIPGGSGKMYFDDFRLYRPEDIPEE
jgi:hypothetical protein